MCVNQGVLECLHGVVVLPVLCHAACSAFADPGVLNRAEWVKFVAVFFNKEVEAERLFANISSSYEQQNSTARKAAADQGKTVAWISKSGDTMAFDYTAYKTQYMTVSTAKK